MDEATSLNLKVGKFTLHYSLLNGISLENTYAGLWKSIDGYGHV